MVFGSGPIRRSTALEKYLNTGIKEVIAQFPAIEQILEAYDIGCGPCAVGTCLLKDVVEIHRMPKEREAELMVRIESAIYPERDILILDETSPPISKKTELTYSPPMQILVDEHVVIKRWLAVIPKVVTALDLESDKGRQVILDGVDMIRSYADKLHHGKEEEILFKYFDDTAEIFSVIYEDHRRAREHVKNILVAVDQRDGSAVSRYLTAYKELLAEHIRKEDEILFPWLDEQLTSDQVEQLLAKFEDVDQRIDVKPQQYIKFVIRLEQQFANME